MAKSDNFIEDRIRWRAEQYNLKASATMFWEDTPLNYKASIPEELGIPVILSVEDVDNYIAVCTRGAFCKNGGEDFIFLHSQVSDFNGQIAKGSAKSELDYLNVSIEDNRDIMVKTEKGEPLSMVWNILRMLQRMS